GMKEEGEKVMNSVNSLLKFGKHDIKLIQTGESEAIACYKKLNADALLVDERTTRHLVEDMLKLKQYMESRTGYSLQINESGKREVEKIVEGISILRSSELFASSFERGVFKKFTDHEILEAGLLSLKFSGCSITDEEIEQYKELLS
ncbi:MAG: hypothetical protein V1911_03805, partial [Candidatus Micrarchaeota archaeon]